MAALWCGRFASPRTVRPAHARSPSSPSSRWLASRCSSFTGCERHRYRLPTRAARRRHARGPRALRRVHDDAAGGAEPGGDASTRRRRSRSSIGVPHERVLIGAGAVLLAVGVAWSAGAGELPAPSFAAHMAVHMTVVAVAAPLLAIGLRGTPGRARPAPTVFVANSRLGRRTDRGLGLARAGAPPRGTTERGDVRRRAGIVPRAGPAPVALGSAGGDRAPCASRRAGAASSRCC